MYIYVHIYTYKHIRVTHTYVCVYMYIYVHIYTYKHTQHAHLQIKGLEEELRKAAEVTESLDRLRMDEKRIHEAIVLDLTEKLNFACTAKRSLERYVHYVKTTYRDVFHRPIAVPII